MLFFLFRASQLSHWHRAAEHMAHNKTCVAWGGGNSKSSPASLPDLRSTSTMLLWWQVDDCHGATRPPGFSPSITGAWIIFPHFLLFLSL